MQDSYYFYKCGSKICYKVVTPDVCDEACQV